MFFKKKKSTPESCSLISWHSAHLPPHHCLAGSSSLLSPPVRPVKCSLWPGRDGSHAGHSLLPPLVDGGDGGHREPAFLRRAAGLGFPAHHAQVRGLLLLPVPGNRWVSFIWATVLKKKKQWLKVKRWLATECFYITFLHDIFALMFRKNVHGNRDASLYFLPPGQNLTHTLPTMQCSSNSRQVRELGVLRW